MDAHEQAPEESRAAQERAAKREARRKRLMEQASQRAGAPKEAYDLDELKSWGGPSKSKAYEDIAAGKLIARKIGRRTVVLHEDLLTYLRNMPICGPGNGAAKDSGTHP